MGLGPLLAFNRLSIHFFLFSFFRNAKSNNKVQVLQCIMCQCGNPFGHDAWRNHNSAASSKYTEDTCNTSPILWPAIAFLDSHSCIGIIWRGLLGYSYKAKGPGGGGGEEGGDGGGWGPAAAAGGEEGGGGGGGWGQQQLQVVKVEEEVEEDGAQQQLQVVKVEEVEEDGDQQQLQVVKVEEVEEDGGQQQLQVVKVEEDGGQQQLQVVKVEEVEEDGGQQQLQVVKKEEEVEEDGGQQQLKEEGAPKAGQAPLQCSNFSCKRKRRTLERKLALLKAELNRYKITKL
ncbi:high mobility group nucleosome-binding domain-containing protein 5-like [Astyanax mexicanus]|uniref:high mobility group nucleosome-binding domain-containing protein 5-like n=1 Tax=Astyanax mexicanus TaxID=7994 RepID=UPI0020CADB8E|nr:high mobility group nucleosome-binding domain-containing protein 5-like [Astyanax mexicanus]